MKFSSQNDQEPKMSNHKSCQSQDMPNYLKGPNSPISKTQTSNIELL